MLSGDLDENCFCIIAQTGLGRMEPEELAFQSDRRLQNVNPGTLSFRRRKVNYRHRREEKQRERVKSSDTERWRGREKS